MTNHAKLLIASFMLLTLMNNNVFGWGRQQPAPPPPPVVKPEAKKTDPNLLFDGSWILYIATQGTRTYRNTHGTTQQKATQTQKGVITLCADKLIGDTIVTGAKIVTRRNNLFECPKTGETGSVPCKITREVTHFLARAAVLTAVHAYVTNPILINTLFAKKAGTISTASSNGK